MTSTLKQYFKMSVSVFLFKYFSSVSWSLASFVSYAFIADKRELSRMKNRYKDPLPSQHGDNCHRSQTPSFFMKISADTS